MRSAGHEALAVHYRQRGPEAKDPR